MFKGKVNDINLLFLLLTLNIFHTFSSVSIVVYEQLDVIKVNSPIFYYISQS